MQFKKFGLPVKVKKSGSQQDSGGVAEGLRENPGMAGESGMTGESGTAAGRVGHMRMTAGQAGHLRMATGGSQPRLPPTPEDHVCGCMSSGDQHRPVSTKNISFNTKIVSVYKIIILALLNQ
jgi:hypothetical protein